MTRRIALLAFLVVAAALVVGYGYSNDSTSSTKPDTTSTTAAKAATSGKVTVTTTDYAFAPKVIAAKAGKLTITLDNKGKAQHELVVLKSDAAPGSLSVAGSGRVSESRSVGEVSETDAGATKSSTLDLKAGKYVYVCNIPGHYSDGMYGSLVVK